MKGPPIDARVEFAVISLLVIAVLSGVFYWYAGNAEGEAISTTAAQRTLAATLPTFQKLFEESGARDGFSPESRAALSDALNGAGIPSDSIVRLRVWNPEGIVVFSTEAGEVGRGHVGGSEIEQALDGDTVNAVALSDIEFVGGELFSAFAPVALPLDRAVVLQVDQPYGPVSDAVAEAQRDVLFYVIISAISAFGLLQMAFWFATRTMARQYARLRYLHNTSQQMRSHLEYEELLGSLARDVAVLTKGDYGSVVLVEDATGDLVMKALFHRSGDETTLLHRKISEWFVGRAVATGQSLTVKLPKRPARALFGLSKGVHGPISILVSPMRTPQRVVGALAVVRERNVSDFPPEEIELAEELAGQAAMAIEQAALFTKVRAHAEELEVSYDNTLKALMAALDTKDSATEGHSERVSKLTVAVAREMKLPADRLVDIERGALLHDVGKIGVPDHILRKPSELTAKEWEAMQQHPLLAAVMVSKVGFLEGALPILLYHHERYDGSGYPFGLVGDKIPLEARIFAVVDTYDAITSERPYRSAASPDSALIEIQASAGTQLDPFVVEAFVAMMRKRLAERARRADEAAA